MAEIHFSSVNEINQIWNFKLFEFIESCLNAMRLSTAYASVSKYRNMWFYAKVDPPRSVPNDRSNSYSDLKNGTMCTKEMCSTSSLTFNSLNYLTLANFSSNKSAVFLVIKWLSLTSVRTTLNSNAIILNNIFAMCRILNHLWSVLTKCCLRKFSYIANALKYKITKWYSPFNKLVFYLVSSYIINRL